MLLFLIARAFAAEPTVDWAPYETMTRTVCRSVATKEELGTLLFAQLALMTEAQMAVVSSQTRLAELRRQVHASRLATDFAHEPEALAADAAITRSIRDLQDETDRLQARIDATQVDAAIASRSTTPPDFPRRSLRRRCRESFADTRADMERVLAAILREGEEVSALPLQQLFVPPTY